MLKVRLIALFVSAVSCNVTMAATPTLAVQALLDSKPGLMAYFDGRHLVALYGAPIAEYTGTGTDWVQTWLAEHPGALGLNNPVLSTPTVMNLRGNKVVLTYRQYLGSFLVNGSLVRIVVQQGTPQKITYIGMRLARPPSGTALAPIVLTGQQARDVVALDPRYSHLTFTEPEQRVYEASEGFYATWSFSGWDLDESWLFFVDGSNGDLVAVEDQMLHEDVTVSTWGYATPCLPPDHSTCPNCCPGDDYPGNPPVPLALPNALVRLVAGDTPPCPSEDPLSIIAEDFTSPGSAPIPGVIGFPDVELPVRATSHVQGRWLTVFDVSPNEHLFECQGLPFCSGNPPICFPNATLVHNLPPHDEFSTAQVNAYVYVDRTHDWFKALQPAATVLDGSVACFTNYYQADPLRDCNAAYLGGADTIVLQRSTAGECRNSASADIIAHEYGHIIVTRMTVAGAAADFNEGVADVIAAFSLKTPKLGFDFLLDGQPVRDLEQSDVYLTDCPSFPGSGNCLDPHLQGLALAGAFWDLRTALIAADPNNGETRANELLADFLAISDGTILDQSVLAELLAADDNDGDVRNGTPRFAQIMDAFVTKHGWDDPFPVPDPSVKVFWDGPPGDPVLGADYFVNHQVIPRNVTLRTTEKSGEPVERWFIGRTPNGRGGARELGAVTADWTAPLTHNLLAVEVGVPSLNIPVLNAHTVDIPAQSAANFTSVVLRLESSEWLQTAKCYASSGNLGGRLSGYVDADFGDPLTHVVARAVGAGQSQSADFLIDLPGKVELGVIPAGSLLHVRKGQGDSITVSEPLLGNLEVDASANWEIHINGTGVSSGNVTIGFLLGGRIRLNGPYGGTMQIADVVNNDPNGPSAYVSGTIETRELSGSIEIHDSSSQAITIHGTAVSTGSILVDGDVLEDLMIEGAMLTPGKIHADADGNGVGDIVGNVTVSGAFSGDVCSAELRSALYTWPLPNHIAIPNFGCDATICGYGPYVEEYGTSLEAKGSRYLAVTVDLPYFEQCPIALFLAGVRPPDGTCLGGYVQADGSVDEETPVYRLASDWGTILVNDIEILPETSYTVWPHLEPSGAFLPPTLVETAMWGDTYPSEPNGIVDIDDLTFVLNTFTTCAHPDSPGCSSIFYAADLSPCGPPLPGESRVLDIDDILEMINAFNHPYTLNCPDPCSGIAPGQGGGHGGFTCSGAYVTLTAGDTSIRPGHAVTIEVRETCLQPLRAFETGGLTVSGGTAGTLTLESITIDETRTDYLLHGQSAVMAVNEDDGRAAAARYSGASTASPSRYQATYTFRASSQAAGTFTISIGSGGMKFRNADGQAVSWQPGPAVNIAIEE